MDSFFRGALGVPFALRVALFMILGMVASAALAESAKAGAITATDKSVLILGGPERNDIKWTTRQVEPNGTDQGAFIRVTDAASPLTIVPGAPCYPVSSPGTVECRTTTYGPVEMQVYLGDGRDTVKEPYEALGHYTRYYTRAVIDGGAGNDKITGTYLGDTLNGGLGNDRIYGGGGLDGIGGGDGNDRLYGRGPALGIWTGSSYAGDVINGGAGVDKLVGDSGNDSLKGESGSDKYVTGSGSDTVVADDGEVDSVKCDSAEPDILRLDLTPQVRDRVTGCVTLH